MQECESRLLEDFLYRPNMALWYGICGNGSQTRTLDVNMQLGIALPHIGPLASPEAIIEVAQKAEALGFDSVWALDVFYGLYNQRRSIRVIQMANFQRSCRIPTIR